MGRQKIYTKVFIQNSIQPVEIGAQLSRCSMDLPKVCRKQQQVLLILSLIYGTNIIVFAEILPLHQYMMYILPKLWQRQASISLQYQQQIANAYGRNNPLLIKLLQQNVQFDCQDSEAVMVTFSSTKQVEFHDPQKIQQLSCSHVPHHEWATGSGGLNVDAHFFSPKMNWPLYQLIGLK